MRTGAFNLVMVDDNDVDAEVVERSIRASAWDIDFRRFATCEEAEAYLASAVRTHTRVDLVLIDLSLPTCDGRTLLSAIKSHPSTRGIAAVIMTSSARESDIADCYARGANGYVTKPVATADFRSNIETVLKYWVSLAPRIGTGPQGTDPPR
ncbi:MAG: response regulator [Candidatus Eisenbacteria bacterium]|uniref:Response regulator n=1 Tax=Eiseniibacteriota bacterium TaxID=2212470 RepID=A0A956NAM6_UNCEI|nr:response regulator [Candidatus Eisenbacteria bacterium]MCB9465597.1 response regulator [Candidatus Eisenbacteria bacterium]